MRPVPLACSQTRSQLGWRQPMPDLQFKATINGRKISRNVKPHQRLLDFIRDDLNLTGNKEGCGAGECGTCSVFVDGTLMKSVGGGFGGKEDMIYQGMLALLA